MNGFSFEWHGDEIVMSDYRSEAKEKFYKLQEEDRDGWETIGEYETVEEAIDACVSERLVSDATMRIVKAFR